MRPGPFLLLSGTTASGKNRVGVLLAERLGGEIVSMDSMKVYRGMDIGTDKPDAELRSRVPHHLVDILSPREGMNLRKYVDLAWAACREIAGRNRLPILVGGTALYLQGFLRGVWDGPPADVSIRARLRALAEAEGVEALHKRLAKVDPRSAGRIHPRDYRRIERALEVFELLSAPISEHARQWEGKALCEYRLFVLTWPRASLDARIEARVDAMMRGGLVDEVRAVLDSGGFGRESSQALGYKEVRAWISGDATLDQVAEAVKARTRRFARRQLTWFRSMKEARWIEAGEGDSIEGIAGRIEQQWRAAVAGGRSEAGGG